MRASSFFFVRSSGGGLGRERLLVQADDVAQAVGLDVERLEAGARLLVARLELEHVLEELDDLLVGPRLLGEQFRRLPEQRRLLGPRPVLRGRRVDVRELAHAAPTS